MYKLPFIIVSLVSLLQSAHGFFFQSALAPSTSLAYSLMPTDFPLPTPSIIRSMDRYLDNSFSGISGDLFDDFFTDLDTFRGSSPFRGIMPIDIDEKSDKYLITVDLPGYGKENIKISVQDGVLTIAGERNREVKDNSKDKYSREERSIGKVSRSFSLPENADAEKISASYENGVLTVSVEKMPEAIQKKERIITIQ
jgi:HSP20 family protein